MDVGFDELVAVVGGFAMRLHADRDSLNHLNVFPVADNDTGSNMVRTLDAITSALEGARDLQQAAASVENAALDGRGNSGLIIGQYLSGFCSAHAGDHIGVERGLAAGASRARAAVAAPVEGTMLTVADAAAASFARCRSLDTLLHDVDRAVRATPTQLAVLAEQGVVDSGAAGLQLFFEALGSVIGTGAGFDDVGSPDELIVCTVGLEALTSSEARSFEVQFRVPSSIVGVEELQQLLGELGTDVVVASSADEVAAHLHVSDPHAVTAAISATLEVRPGAAAISYDVEPIMDVGRGEVV